MEGALSRHDRADRAVAGRKGHFRRSRHQHHRHRFRQLHRASRQRDPAAQGRPHRRDRGRGRQDRLVPDRSATFASTLRAPMFTSSATRASAAASRSPLRLRRRKAKACAAAIVSMLSGKTPETPRLNGACYNIVAPGYAFSLQGVYQPKDGQFAEVEGRDQPGRRAARGPRARGRRCARLVQDHHG